MSQGVPVDRTTITVCSVSRPSIASSTACLTGAVWPRRRAPSVVMSALACEMAILSCTADGAKPPNTTLCGAPIRAQASIATTTSGIIGR